MRILTSIYDKKSYNLSKNWLYTNQFLQSLDKLIFMTKRKLYLYNNIFT